MKMGTCSSTPAMCFAKKRNKSIDNNNGGVRKKIKGTAVLMKKNVLDLNDFGASFFDRVHEFLGKGVLLQFVSAVHGDQGQPSLSLSLSRSLHYKFTNKGDEA